MKSAVAAYLETLGRTLEQLDVTAVERAIELIREARDRQRKVLACGNGGSALTASHYISDWNKAIHLATGRPFRGIALTDNVGLLTAYANDISYQDVFREQLKNLMDEKDLVIAVSGSGNSPNVVRAVEYANEHGGVTLALCGQKGGAIRTLAHHSVWIRCDDMEICEDLHFVFGHLVKRALCEGAARG